MGLSQRSVLRIVEASPRDPEPQSLVPSIAAGDEAAVARFCEATSGLLFGLLLRILGDTATADEVLLGVYDEVRLEAARFERNGDSLLTWLITITHRRALERLCQSREDQQFLVAVGLASERDSGPLRGVGIRKSAHRRLVGATLNSVSAAELKMIEMAYFSRMTPVAIAAKLGQSPETVRAGLHCGILRLDKLFRNHGSLSEA